MASSEIAKKWIVLMIAGCLLFSGTLFFANLGRRDLWNPDEPRYAQIAKEMTLCHAYGVPRLNETVYTQKPPLFFWMVVGSFKVFHTINEWTARFPVALSAVLCVLFVFLIGRQLFDPWTGVFSALLLATTSEFFWLAIRVNLDTVMTLFILISFYLIIRGLDEERRRNLWFRLAFLFAGIATVVKGPLGIVVPFLTLIVYLLIMREFKTLKRIPWISGFGIFALTLAVGLGPSCWMGGKAYTHELLFRQTLTRYLHGINHKAGALFYLYTYPESLLPWVLFLPAAILLIFRKIRDPQIRPALSLVLVWMVAPLVFLSFSGSKRQLYILPLIPAGCLLIGYYVSLLFRGERRFLAWFRVPVYGVGVLLVVAGIVLPFVPRIIQFRFPELTLRLVPFIGIAIFCMVTGLILCFLNGSKRIRSVLWVMILIFFGVYFSGSRWILPLFNTVKSPRALGTEIQKLVDEGVDLRTFMGLEHAGILFYTHLTRIGTIPPTAEGVAFFKTSPKAAVLLIRRQLKMFARLSHVPLRVLWKGRIGHRKFLILEPVTVKEGVP